MLQTIPTKGLSFGTVFKILFLGTLFSVGPLLMIAGICSYFGAQVLTLNGIYVTGLKGLIVGIVMAPIFSLITAILLGILITLGLWIFTRFKNLMINIKPV